MAARMFRDVQGLVNGLKIIAGSFGPDTANAPTKVRGKGFTVARTSAGLFTVTLDDKYYELEAASLTLQLASGDDKVLQLGSVDLSAKTIQIRVWDISGAAVADIAINDNNRINFVLFLKNSSAP